jgi:hypothetical protein
LTGGLGHDQLDNAAHRSPCLVDAGLLPVEDLALLQVRLQR